MFAPTAWEDVILHTLGKTVLVTTHDVDFATEWADRVLLLKDGQLVASGGPEISVDPHWIEAAHLLHVPKDARPFLLIQDCRLNGRH